MTATSIPSMSIAVSRRGRVEGVGAGDVEMRVRARLRRRNSRLDAVALCCMLCAGIARP